MIRVALIALLGAGPAMADRLDVEIDKSDQTMRVRPDGRVAGQWPVSTARAGKVTPEGKYAPQSLVRMHCSSLYNNAPMPFSIFFHGNYAIHGTDQVDRLGSPASAGCVRLDLAHADVLFGLMREVGKEETRISIVE